GALFFGALFFGALFFGALFFGALFFRVLFFSCFGVLGFSQTRAVRRLWYRRERRTLCCCWNARYQYEERADRR
ncbi:MAG: hypothetical protein ACJAYU_003506, partial [Bradymonadia bacterium]